MVRIHLYNCMHVIKNCVTIIQNKYGKEPLIRYYIMYLENEKYCLPQSS